MTRRPSLNLLSPARVLAVAAVLGLAVDLLFYGKAPGISVTLFVLAVVAALFLLGRAERVPLAWRNLWLVAPLLFFAAMTFVRASLFVTLHNVAAVVLLLFLLAYYYASGRADRMGVLGYPIAFLGSLGNSLARSRLVVRAGLARPAGAVKTQGVPRLLPLLRGLLLATPVLFVFTCLLASADMLFARALDDLFQHLFLFNLLDASMHAGLVLGAAWVLAGVLAYALSRRTDPNANAEAGEFRPLFTIGFVEASTVLVLVDLLFVSFAWIQFSYLFGAQEWAARGAWDYRDYARRGFGELTVVAVLSLALILNMQHLTWRQTERQGTIFKLLSTLMVGLVLVFLASAWYRMFYWEQVEAYMFTQKRIYVRIFIAWLALAFGWLLVTLWLLPKRFAIGGFAAVLGFLVTLNVVNPDANVVEYNLKTYERTGVIDAEYLYILSEDAVPAIVQAFEEMPPERRELLRNHLSGRLALMERDTSWRAWQSFHWSRTQAYQLLSERREELTATGQR